MRKSKRSRNLTPQPAVSPAGQEISTPPVLRGPVWRFAAIFGVCALSGFALLMLPWVQPAVAVLTKGLVSVSALLISVAGGSALAREDIMRSEATGFAIRMANGCNGVHVMIVLWSAMLAFPASAKQKVQGLIAGSVLIHAVNLVRFISLFFLGQFAPAWFEFAHTYFWESMIMLDSLVIFWLWAQYVFRSSVTANAGT